MTKIRVLGILLPSIVVLAGSAWAAESERMLLFPLTYPVGNVYVESPNVRTSFSAFHSAVEGSAWQYWSLAQGQVTVPRHLKVHLCLSLAVLRRPFALDFLSRLQQGDLYRVSNVNEACLSRMGHLEGLHIIELAPGVGADALSCLEDFPMLERVTLPRGLTDAGLAAVTRCRGLKALCFHANRVTDTGLQQLAALQQLEELVLGGGALSDQALIVLTHFDHLKRLRLWGPFTDEALKYASFALSLESIQVEIVSYTPTGSALGITDRGMQHLALGMTLQDIRVRHARAVTGKGLRHLKAMPSLRSLDVRSASLHDEDLRHFSAFPDMKQLVLPDTGLTDRGVALLGPLTKLTLLSVGMSPQSSLSDQAVSVVTGMKGLEELRVSGTGITEQGLQAIGELSQLKRLWIDMHQSLTPQAMTALTGLSELRELSFGQNTVVQMSSLAVCESLDRLEKLSVVRLQRDDGVLTLPVLNQLTSLVLQLGGTGQADSVFIDQDVACLESLIRLQTLELRSPGLTDFGVRRLKGLSDLQWLYIGGSHNVTEQGIGALPHDKLQHLTIGHCRINDPDLVCLHGYRSLESLKLGAPGYVSRKTVTQLKKRLPLLQSIQIN